LGSWRSTAELLPLEGIMILAAVLKPANARFSQVRHMPGVLKLKGGHEPALFLKQFLGREKRQARASLSDKRLEGSRFQYPAPGSLQVGQFSPSIQCSVRESCFCYENTTKLSWNLTRKVFNAATPATYLIAGELGTTSRVSVPIRLEWPSA